MPDEEPPQPETIRSNPAPEGVTKKMTAGGGGLWEPPTIEQAEHLFPGYEVLGLLGRGGMGVVYQARQIELDRLVAIKLLPLEISADMDFADRFRREARAMAKLNHPNIISVYDFGTTSEGHLYFVMEFVEGANLHAIIRAQELSPDQALWLAGQVCTALAYAHGKGVVHRDIKPANVMVDMEGNAKVADFGLARLTDPSAEQFGHTQTGTVMGTPDYMAPEQMRGMNVDHRADIYSVGVMLYEMLCREVPRGIFSPPSVRTGCDQRVDTIVVKAMQSEPDRRYQSTQEMQADMETARVPVATTQAQPRAIAPASPAKPKRPHYVGIAAAALLLGALGFILVRLAKPKPKIAAAAKSFRSVVSESESSAARPLESGAIKLWDTPEKVARLKSKDARWENGALVLNGRSVARHGEPASRDCILRASIRANLDALSPTLRVRAQGNTGSDEFYKLDLVADQQRLDLYYGSRDKEEQQQLKRWPLPRAYGPNEWVPIEWRVIGDEFTVSVDGQVLGSVRDERLVKAGSVVLFAQANGYFRDIVYVPLDQASSARGDSAAAWQPLVDEADWKKSRPGQREFVDGVLHLKMKNIARDLPGADGAIRARIVFRKGSENVALFARSSGGNETYKLNVRHTGEGVFLAPIGPDGKNLEKIGFKAFPKPLRPGDKVTIELRVQGDRLTALIDGEVAVEGQNSLYSQPGAWGIMADDGWFEMAEYRALGGAETSVAASAASEPWRDWMVEARDKSFFPGRFEVAGDRFVVREPGGLTWEYALMVRNMAVRATWQPDNQPPLIPEVMARTATDGTGRHYAARVVNGKVHLSERRQSGGTTSTRTIQEWPLPTGFDAKADQLLELRVVDDLLTVRLNGEEIGSARDGALTHTGTAGAFVTKGTIIRKLEYLNLDPLTSATASRSDVPEKWEDLIAVGGWPAPWTIENGILGRPAKTKVERKWDDRRVQDGAWRVTRRWHGGWYDLQLMLRLRGPNFLLLQFLEPKNDQIVVRVSAGDSGRLVGEGRTKKRFATGDIITIEFRAVGNAVTVSIDGEVVVAARDDAPAAGAFAMISNYGEAPVFHKVEFLTLDPAR